MGFRFSKVTVITQGIEVIDVVGILALWGVRDWLPWLLTRVESQKSNYPATTYGFAWSLLLLGALREVIAGESERWSMGFTSTSACPLLVGTVGQLISGRESDGACLPV